MDIAAFMLSSSASSEPMLPDDEYAVFYDNVSSPCCSVRYSEDLTSPSSDRSGSAKEKISADLGSVPDTVTHILFLAAIHNAHERKQSFSQYQGARIRIFDDDRNEEIMNLNLEEEMPSDTGVEIACFRREYNRWLLVPLGEGDASGLEFYFNKYLDGLCK